MQASGALSSDIWHGAIERLRENVTRTQAKSIKFDPVPQDQMWDFYRRAGWKFTDTETEVLDDPSRFIVLEVARRWGKTEIAIKKTIATMACRPGALCAYIPRHRKVLERNWPRFTREFEHCESMGLLRVVGRRDVEKEIALGNFSNLTAGSFDHATTWVGSGYDLVIGDEAALFDDKAWNETIEPAISDRHGSIMLISTPFGDSWLTDLSIDEMRGLRRQGRQEGIRNADELTAYVEARREWRYYNFPSWTNTFVFPGGENDPEIKRLRRVLTVEDFAQQIMGIPKPSRDRIYTEFREDVHCGIIDFDEKKDVSLGVDPSMMGSNPYAVVAAQDLGDQVRFFDEYHQTGVLADDVMANLRQRPWWRKVRLIVIDDAHPSEVVRWRGLLQPGEKVDVVTAKKAEVSSGIALVRKWLRDPTLYHKASETIRDKLLADMQAQLDEGERITPEDYHYIEHQVSQAVGIDELRLCARIFVDHTCENTIRGFRKYRSKSRRDESRNSLEKPLDADDHEMDALRYLIWYTKRRFDPLLASGWWAAA